MKKHEWFPLDLNFDSDPKIACLILEFGAGRTIASVVTIYAALYNESACQLPMSLLGSIAKRLECKVEELRAFIDRAAHEDIGLLVISDGVLSCPAVDKRAAKVRAVSNARSTAAKAKHSPAIAEQMQSNCKPNAEQMTIYSSLLSSDLDLEGGVGETAHLKLIEEKMAADPIQCNALKAEFSRFKLTDDDIRRAVICLARHYDKHPETWRDGRFWYSDLVSFPLTQATKDRTALLKMQAADPSIPKNGTGPPRPQPKEVRAGPEPPPLTPEQVVRNKQLSQEFLNRKKVKNATAHD